MKIFNLACIVCFLSSCNTGAGDINAKPATHEKYDQLDRMILLSKAVESPNKPVILAAFDSVGGKQARFVLWRFWYPKYVFEKRYDSVLTRLKYFTALVDNFVLDDSNFLFKNVIYDLRDLQEEQYTKGFNAKILTHTTDGGNNTEERARVFRALIYPGNIHLTANKIILAKETSYPGEAFLRPAVAKWNTHLAQLAYVDLLFHDRRFDTIEFVYKNTDKRGMANTVVLSYSRTDTLFSAIRSMLDKERSSFYLHQ